MRAGTFVALSCALLAAAAAGAAPEAGQPTTSGELRESPPDDAWGWRRNGQPAPPAPWRGSDGPFGAMLLLTDRPEEFFAEWEQPDLPGHEPRLHPVSEARRGDTVTALILFAHCAPDPLGNCRSAADFTVRRPDGSVYAKHPGAPVWTQPAPADRRLRLGEARLVFHVEAADPLGTYQFEAAIRHEVTGRRVLLRRSLVVKTDPVR